MATLATDLHVSLTDISLTITAYMVCLSQVYVYDCVANSLQIFQGVAPTIVGGISDRYGRRPTYLLCFTIYVAANFGLALLKNYSTLVILRCVQSAGSSGTTALSSAVVSDVATRQQRGSYTGLAALGSSLGPALGPAIGGLLNHFLGWRAIFWFLAIYGGVMILVYLIFIPETCRNIVGNGSIPPQRWNTPLIAIFQKRDTPDHPSTENTVIQKKRPGIFSSIPILFDRENFLILIFSGIFYAGYYIIITGLPSQLASTNHYNSIQVGLCYLPIGAGSLLIRPFVGRIMDLNFRRHARKTGIEIQKNVQCDIEDFPVESARLEIACSFVYLACICVIPYGWMMGLEHPPLPAVLVLLFFVGLSVSAAFQPFSALIIDINTKSAASASAVSNLVRCLLGAGGVAIVNPLYNAIDRGWTGTLVALVWVVTSSCWWMVMRRGPRWRKLKERKNPKQAIEAAKDRQEHHL